MHIVYIGNKLVQLLVGDSVGAKTRHAGLSISHHVTNLLVTRPWREQRRPGSPPSSGVADVAIATKDCLA
jgi:hypothetical protein